jgi:hypothetical protein
MGSKGDIGKRVIINIDGKVQDKKDGRPTGKWIEFKKGDVGRIVEIKEIQLRWKIKTRMYLVRLKDRGIVELRSNCLLFPGDIKMSRRVIAENRYSYL